MKLISCDECAVILDADKLNFPHNIYKEDGSVDRDKAEWDGDDYVPKANCPVCRHSILKDS